MPVDVDGDGSVTITLIHSPADDSTSLNYIIYFSIYD